MAFSSAKIISILSRNATDIPVFVFQETCSTNNDARNLSMSHKGDFLVAADCQTGGRGTHERKFYSPAGTGFYMSVAIPDVSFEIPVVLAAAVAAVQTLKQVAGVDVDIKWVNDILLDGRKAGGILCERSGSGVVIVGLGLNLKEPEGGFPEDIKLKATQLGIDTELCNEIAAWFYIRLTRLLRERPDSILPLYKDVCSTLGKKIKCTHKDETITATAKSIAENGALIVELEDGTSMMLNSGEVSIIPVGEE